MNSYLKHNRVLSKRWIKSRTEDSNFYYSLSAENRQQLIHFVSTTFSADSDLVRDYFREIEDNEYLIKAMSGYLGKLRYYDSAPEIGRRVAWYAIIRLLKPKVVIETGVHHGVGGLVICLALLSNRLEGNPGKYIGVDIDPSAGELIDLEIFDFAQLVFNNSHSFLDAVDFACDLFIHDSDHSAEFETGEYMRIHGKMTEDAIIISDNSHASPSLRAFSENQNRPFYFFREVPNQHWYPGAGIGISKFRDN